MWAWPAAMLLYSSDELRPISCKSGPPKRHVRKAIFSLRLWWPRPRRSTRLQPPVDSADAKPKANNGISVGLLNVRSVAGKFIAVSDTIETKFLDVLAATETWHCASEDLALRRCAPAGYSIVDAARQDARPSSTAARGGGVALIHSNRFTSKRLVFDVKPTTFEVLGCTLRSASAAAVYVECCQIGRAHV